MTDSSGYGNTSYVSAEFISAAIFSAGVWEPKVCGVFLYWLSTSWVEKSGEDSLCGVAWSCCFRV